MNFTAADVVPLLSAHAYEILLPLSIVEGPIVTIIGGVLVVTGHLEAAPVFAIVVLGDLIGDALFYAFGRSVGLCMLARWANPGTLERARDLERRILRKSDQTLVVGKLTHSVGALVLVAAGIVKVPFPRFIAVNFLATLPKSAALLAIGIAVGSGYRLMPQHSTYLLLALFAVGGIALYALFVR